MVNVLIWLFREMARKPFSSELLIYIYPLLLYLFGLFSPGEGVEVGYCALNSGWRGLQNNEKLDLDEPKAKWHNWSRCEEIFKLLRTTHKGCWYNIKERCSTPPVEEEMLFSKYLNKRCDGYYSAISCIQIYITWLINRRFKKQANWIIVGEK